MNSFFLDSVFKGDLSFDSSGCIELLQGEELAGFFFESFNQKKFTSLLSTEFTFVQDNHSKSAAGVLRGLHYQIRQAQGKLVRVTTGKIFDVAVDVRKSSPTFGQWAGITLDAKQPCQLWIPPGFAHGFYVLSDWAEVIYKTTDYYAPQWERTLLWNDPAIGIEWPLLPGTGPTLSPKDAEGKLLKEVEVFE